MTFSPAPKPERKPKKPRKWMPRTNPERRARNFEQDFGPKADWIRSLADWISGSEGTASDPIVAGHGRSRGAGGDSRDLLPWLASDHDESHRVGILTFLERKGLTVEDMERATDATHQRWLAFAQMERPNTTREV